MNFESVTKKKASDIRSAVTLVMKKIKIKV